MTSGTLNRDRVLDEVITTPGITKTEVMESLEIGWGTVDHHLNKLCRESLLEVYRVNPRAHYFAPDIPIPIRPIFAALRLEHSKRMLGLLEQPLRAQDLVNEMGESRKVVDRHLAHLTRSGAVERNHFSYTVSKFYRRRLGRKD
jgi:predicted transcriptional regulator